MPNKIDFYKKNSKVNKDMSLNNRLECNNVIKADDISTNEINKILAKNKIMNDSERNSNLFKKIKKMNKNFLRKKFVKGNDNYKTGQKDEECLPDEFFKNHIFQYYYSTIEYLKKYYNAYMNSDYNNNISKNNNVLNLNNYYLYDKNICNLSYKKTLNINNNINMINNFFINNNQNKKINFIYSNCKNVKDKNKTSGSYNNLEKEDTKKINAFSKEAITNNNLNSNNNELQNLIININCPSFRSSNYKNNKNSNINSKSNKISNEIENKNKGKENSLEEEYCLEMYKKKGWICALCNNFNFEARIKCNRCKALKNPKKITNIKSRINNGINPNNDVEDSDWICSKCQNLNYSFRIICNKCKAPKLNQFAIKPFLYQNIICNNIFRFSPGLMPFYAILNNMPNVYLNKVV